jgi:hypothetical protein
MTLERAGYRPHTSSTAYPYTGPVCADCVHRDGEGPPSTWTCKATEHEVIILPEIDPVTGAIIPGTRFRKLCIGVNRSGECERFQPDAALSLYRSRPSVARQTSEAELWTEPSEPQSLRVRSETDLTTKQFLAVAAVEFAVATVVGLLISLAIHVFL